MTIEQELNKAEERWERRMAVVAKGSPKKNQ